jgi:hypothetical protein
MPALEKQVAMDLECAVLIEQITKVFGSVPQVFQKCFHCAEPAYAIVCGTFPDPKWADAFENCQLSDDARNVVEALRSAFGTNAELPMCEAHLNSPQPQ